MIRRLILFAVLLAATGDVRAAPGTASFDPSIGRVEVTLDLPKDKPYVGEMIMLRMRSFIRADIVLDDIRQPPLTNFDSQQLGRDRPIQAMVDGYRVAGVERDLAIFPQQSGRLIIEPFVRHVTIVQGENQRVEADFQSKPVYVDVQNYAAINKGDAWWLPAKSLTLTDTWSTAPDEIKPGTLARRTITVEAVGLTGDRLPPAPDMLAPGTIAFKGPAERSTTITEDGPVAHATYRWDLRPVSPSPAKMPAVHVAWFDTGERRIRDAAIPSLWVAYLGTLIHTSHEAARGAGDLYLAAGPVTAGVAGFAWTAAFAAFLATRRAPRSRRDRAGSRLLSTLRRAGRFRDERGFANALAALARSDPARWRAISTNPLVAGRLAALDAARYGRNVGAPAPPLLPLATDLRALWRATRPAPRESVSLPPLDGAVVAPLGGSWAGRLRDRLASR